MALASEDTNQSDKLIKGENVESKALVEMERWIEQEGSKCQSLMEDLEGVNLGDESEKNEVRVGRQMPPDLRHNLIKLLRECADIFAWSYRDMPGLGREIVEHKLPLLPDLVLVRQQLRRIKPKVALKIKEEVEKQWNARFLTVWVANIVPVPKKDVKVQMCVDYKDLNRASLKDNFPLPHIDVLVENTVQHVFFSFMDGFSGYNQIQMALENIEK
ncbi:hypothetical protein CR513_44663, partial [Mucuna pruriens]